MSRRIERLNEQVKREVSDILRSEVRDPRVGIVTVTEARVAPDLSIARVYVRPMGDEKEQEAALEGLAAASPYVRRELSKRLKVRTVPELRFEADKALDYGLHIEKLLSEIKKAEDQ
ncbi:MAG: 30S ribosome-binding factor RbfA [Gemmatimonadota bacterium]